MCEKSRNDRGRAGAFALRMYAEKRYFSSHFLTTYVSSFFSSLRENWKLYGASKNAIGGWRGEGWDGRQTKIKLLGNLPFIFSSFLLWLSFQMRYTKKVSMWPVGLITKYGVSSPIVRNGTISGFYDGWIGGRKFPVDMAGFAVNVNFLLSRPNASMPYKPGYEEDGFLKSLSPLNLTEIEVMATNCTQVC